MGISATAIALPRWHENIKSDGDVLMTGGGANNDALRAALEDILMCDIYKANHPQYNGVVGASIIGRQHTDK